MTLGQDTMDQQLGKDDAIRDPAFVKMEKLIREMQDTDMGVPVRSQKTFLSSIPCAFLGYDVVEWLMDHLQIEDTAEALHLANLLCQHGYFFPVNDNKPLTIKDDSTLYRFQTPYFWPSHHQPNNTDYAIYLVKQTKKNKQKHNLEEFEQEALARLKKLLCHKWEFICLQAEEQANLLKERKKTDKVVLESQEKAYWHVHQPPPGCINCLEQSPVANKRSKRKKAVKDLKLEIEMLTNNLTRSRFKVSQAVESLIHWWESYSEFDPFLTSVPPSNPWVTDDTTLWTIDGRVVDPPTEKRVKRWAISLEEMLSDPRGMYEFEQYLRKEYSYENIKFWQSVQDLRHGCQTEVSEKVKEIYDEFLSPNAPCEVNLDSKTIEITQERMKQPNRYTFDSAQLHVFSLMKNDSYPRFIRSDYYHNLLLNAVQPSAKKKFCNFGTSVRKKSAPTPSTSTKHRGSSGQLAGSIIDLTPGLMDKMKWPFCGRHSHSTSDLHELGTPHDKTASSTMSSPSGSHEHMNEATHSMLQVPRWTHRGSDSTVLEDPNLGLFLAVPCQIKNLVAPWETKT